MHTFDIQHFLSHFWQQKPVVIRGLFSSFNDPIDEHDLAGLAQEEEVDSRIIRYLDGQWDVEQGPISDFTRACVGSWTLLVQGVDRYIHDVAPVFEPFRFLPHWRLDDLMVSFATEGAGVGAHIDQYDVFLVQGKGSRRWRVGAPGHYEDIFPHPKLKQIPGFEPVIDEVLQPGDVLYIPPGWPHDGVALEDCLTYSVGFRAPDSHQLADSLSFMLETGEGNDMYTDPNPAPSVLPATLTQKEIKQLKQQLIACIESDHFTHAMLASLSEQGLPEYPPEELYTRDDIEQAFLTGAPLASAPGVRGMMTDLPHADYFYVNGERFDFQPDDKAWVELLLNSHIIDVNMHEKPPSFAFLETLTTLINKGYWEWLEA
mgnify:FL=1